MPYPCLSSTTPGWEVTYTSFDIFPVLLIFITRRYYNYKNFHSIILSGIVDAQGRFLSIDAGFYGRLGDSGCLQHSPIWHDSMHGPLFSDLGYYLYGDSAYPLKSWLLKGYPASTATFEQIKFNTRGSRARVIVECAYGKLKASDTPSAPFIFSQLSMSPIGPVAYSTRRASD